MMRTSRSECRRLIPLWLWMCAASRLRCSLQEYGKVSKQHLLVDAAVSEEWTPWSECSRSCGTGVSTRCLFFKDRLQWRSNISDGNLLLERHRMWQHGTVAHTCNGHRTEYRLCNTKPCPGTYSNFRREQCRTLDEKVFMGRQYRWEPYETGVSACALLCQAVGTSFYTTNRREVIDGTLCYEHSEDWICIRGRCEHVGCDGAIGSALEDDRCGKCGGNGGTCSVVSGTYEQDPLSPGYHQVTRIPARARSINITESSPSDNLIALRSENGVFLFNGNAEGSFPGMYRGSGANFLYSIKPGSSLEKASAKGPLLEYVDVLVYSWGKASRLEYTYSIDSEDSASSWATSPQRSLEKNKRSDVYDQRGSYRKPRGDEVEMGIPLGYNETSSGEVPKRRRHEKFMWKTVQFGECSATCGRGVQRPMVRCIDVRSFRIVGDHLCQWSRKHNPAGVPCYKGLCPPSWFPVGWSSCNASCGNGTKFRSFLCKKEISSKSFVPVPDASCGLPPPVETKSCKSRPCSRWFADPWTQCSASCGGGLQYRKVRCEDAATGRKERAEDCDPSERPPAKRACNVHPCSGRWLHTEWQDQCADSCEGVQTRKVVCIPGSCDALEEPQHTRPCIGSKEGGSACAAAGKWFVGSWSECSADCGFGMQTRHVVCLRRFRGHLVTALPHLCPADFRPDERRRCSLFPCDSEWYMTEWSECSRACGGGTQTREAHCLDHRKKNSTACEPLPMGHTTRSCNTHDCPTNEDEFLPQITLRDSDAPAEVVQNVEGDSAYDVSTTTEESSEEGSAGEESDSLLSIKQDSGKTPPDTPCEDRLSTCKVVVQARLCRLAFYHGACCQSCGKATSKET